MKTATAIAALLACLLALGNAAEPPRQLPDPTPATCALRVPGGGAGSGTVVGPRRKDGRWLVLTAAHVVGPHQKADLILRDGRRLAATVLAASHRYGYAGGRLTFADGNSPDLAWLATDDATLRDLPHATLAARDPEPGAKVWHRGFARHGLMRLDGEARAPDGYGGVLALHIDFEGGDSGGGVFRADTNELVAVASSTAKGGEKANAWGGGASAARKLLPAE